MVLPTEMQTNPPEILIGRTASKPAGWLDRVSRLFIAALILNVIQVMQGYWWPETYIPVYVTLGVAVLVDLLVPLKRLHRTLAGFVVVLILNGLLIPQLLTESLQTVQNSLFMMIWDYMKAIHPFIEISLGVWIAYILFAVWTTTRGRIIGFTVICLLILTVADSFTPIHLWDNVAWSVFVTLIWMIAEHFAGFQRKYPRSWKELFRYPAKLMLPIVLIVALVMSSGLFVPEIAPVLRDPYSIWKESRGEAVKSYTGDKGAGSVTDDNKYNSQSGFRRDDRDLGGGFLYDYSPVMTVKSNEQSYWRAETKSEYTGGGWQDSFIEHAEARLADIKPGEKLPLEDYPKAQTVKVLQTVTMKHTEPFPVLFGAAPVSEVISLDTGENSRFGLSWGPSSFELGVSSFLGYYPESYTLLSEVVKLDESGLRQTSAGWTDKTRNGPYLQLPAELPLRVKELATEITAGATNDYDKAKKIETYLRTHFPYTNSPNLNMKNSNDFVDSFLFEIKKGYCDYFSSAMAVLARSAGLPARWVKGYASGTFSLNTEPDNELSELDKQTANEIGTRDIYTVRNADAHSWVEIYFDGYGWIPFEATPGFTFPYAREASTDTSDVKSPGKPEVENHPTSPVTNAQPTSTIPAYVPVTGISLLVAIVGVWMFVRRKWIADRWSEYRVRSFTANQRIVWETEKLIKAARRRGLTKAEHETLREAVLRWSSERSELQADLELLLRAFERAKYSGIAATAEEVQLYVRQVRNIREQL